MPTLRYYVGNSSSTNIEQITKTNLTTGESSDQSLPIILRWKAVAGAVLYRLEIEDETGRQIFSAVILPAAGQLSNFLVHPRTRRFKTIEMARQDVRGGGRND